MTDEKPEEVTHAKTISGRDRSNLITGKLEKQPLTDGERKRDRIRAHLRRRNDKIASTFLDMQQKLFEDMDHIKTHLHNKKLEFKISTKETLKRWKGEEASIHGPITLEIASDVESSFIKKADCDTFTVSYFPTNNGWRQYTQNRTHAEERVMNNSIFKTDETRIDHTDHSVSADYPHLKSSLKDESVEYFSNDQSFVRYIDARFDSESIGSTNSSEKQTLCSSISTSKIIYPSMAGAQFDGDPTPLLDHPNLTHFSGFLAENDSVEPSLENDKDMQTENLSNTINSSDTTKKFLAWEYKDDKFVKVPCTPPNEDNVEWDIDHCHYYKQFSLKEKLKKKRLRAAEKMYSWVRHNYLKDSVSY